MKNYNSNFSILADGKKLALFIILKRTHLSKEKLSSNLILKCDEKSWKKEIMNQWPKETWDR
jgi:hypothetical protein